MDTSALMAIALGEKEADDCIRVLETETEVIISAGTAAEALIVAARRNVGEEMTRIIDGLGFEIVSVTTFQKPMWSVRFRSKWDLKGIDGAVDVLTAAIQNDFPEYAMTLSR